MNKDREKKFKSFYSELNTEQKKAVEALQGPVMVVAGPGTGKTQIIALRIANILIKTDAGPDNILALTFTESGTKAMKQRLYQIIGPEAHKLHIYTFHGFAEEVLSTFPEKFIFAKKLDLIDPLDQLNLINSIIDQNDFVYIKPFKDPHHWTKEIVSIIDQIKKEDVNPEQLLDLIDKELEKVKNDPEAINKSGKFKGRLKQKFSDQIERLKRSKEFCKIYTSYQKKMIKNGLYDFNDLILYVLKALKNDKELLSYYQEKFLYILADEYQDTNSAQNEILNLLGNYDDNPNLFVVGDDEQSIYRFQGAAIENMLSYRENYPEAQIIVLKTNYRSTQILIDASKKVISHNRQQIAPLWNLDKNFFAHDLDQKFKINIGKFTDEDIENYFCVSKIKELLKSGIEPQKIAVLYRQNQYSESLRHILEQEKIDYVIENGNNILDDFEIQKLITIFKVIAFAGNTKDNDENVFESMHYEFFGINPVDIYRLNFAAKTSRQTLFDFALSEKNLNNIRLNTKDNIIKYFNTIIQLKKDCRNQTFSAFFQNVILETGYYDWLTATKDSIINLNHLNQLFDQIKILNRKNKHLKIENFLQYLAGMEENDLVLKEKELNPDIPAIRLMTCHRAKGLEFETVFIIHATQSSWIKQKRELIKMPCGIVKTVKGEIDEEEERRLFYVAMTRAKKQLYLSCAEHYFNSNKNETLCAFSDEIPEVFKQEVNPEIYQNNWQIILDNKLKPKPQIKNQSHFDKYIDEILQNFVLNPTGLNDYLKCPRYFLYNNLLKIPQAKTFSQSYGTAIHHALEEFFKEFRKVNRLPDVKFLIDSYKEGIEKEIFLDQDLAKALKEGQEILTKYYEYYHESWKTEGAPLYCEYNFSADKVLLDNIPITGKVDKVKILDNTAKIIAVVDYKTAKPKSENEVRGLTQAADRSLLNQLLFYCLLGKHDPLFHWYIKETVLDFVNIDKGKFKTIKIQPTIQELSEMEELIRMVYQKIMNHEFTHLNSRNCEYCSKTAKISTFTQLAQLDIE